MDCILRHITHYPFQLHTEKNIMALTYTCLADTNTSDQLEIQTHGYRYILDDQNQEIMLFVIRDDSLISSEVDPVLHVPYNVLRRFTEAHPNVLVIRKITQMKNFLLPVLKDAQEVNIYFNETFDSDKAIIAMLTQSNYIFTTGEYYLEFSWIQELIGNVRSLKAKLQLKQNLTKHQSSRYHNYLRVYLEPKNQENQGEYFIFKNGVTKVNLKHINLHPYNIFHTINLDKTERHVFELEPYLQLGKSIRAHSNSNRILLLQAENHSGVNQFIHKYSQTVMKVNYHCIDCNYIFSTQQFFRKLNWIINLQDAVVLIQNLDWLMQLYQAEQILSMQMKHVMSKLESEFKTITEKTLRHYLIVLQYQGKTITEDMFQQASSLSLNLDKPLKLYIFKMVFNHYDADYQHRDQIVQQYHDKFGWKVLKEFMEKEWATIKGKSVGDIMKQLSKRIQHQDVQNLIEVSWDDVGGLESAKEQIIQTILLPIKHPEIFDEWIKPRTGLLFYGPPGTGKTLLGKCIAKECKMSFISVKGPELLNMYVGQSEKNVRQVFERAIACKPCIVFMDELDALIPKRGNNTDSHQVMDRIVAELLMQMDLASSNQVFVIGATNRPDLLDPSILRAGRFDKQIYLGITKNKEDRIKVLKAQTRHLKLEENLDWSELLEKLPQNFTGADFYGLTSKAVMAAADRAIEEYEMGVQNQIILIKKQDFLVAAQHVKPSVTEADLQKYDELKKIYS